MLSSGNLFLKCSLYPLHSQKPILRNWFFCWLSWEFEVNSKGYKTCINMIFIHFLPKSYICIWSSDRESKIRDDIKSLNTNDVLSKLLKIERENTMKPKFNLKCDIFLSTIYLWIGTLKTCIHQRKLAFFLRKLKSEGETIWQ